MVQLAVNLQDEFLNQLLSKDITQEMGIEQCPTWLQVGRPCNLRQW